MAASSCFIGVDLAWSPRNTSGVAALFPTADGLVVAAGGIRRSDAEICDFVGQHLAPTTIIMVDAPLVVLKESGMRDCDRLTHQRFGRYHAGAYPANRANMSGYNSGTPRGEALGLLLSKRYGFAWPPKDVMSAVGKPGRFLFECYPHPAHVILFGLERTLKYKRKRQGLDKARAEFARYREFICGLSSPRINIDDDLVRALDVSSARGRLYKECEDRLDALFCAYLAALVPERRMECIGKPEEGCITVPTP